MTVSWTARQDPHHVWAARLPHGSVRRGRRRRYPRGLGPLSADGAFPQTVILLHPPLPVLGVSIVMERERQQNDSLADC